MARLADLGGGLSADVLAALMGRRGGGDAALLGGLGGDGLSHGDAMTLSLLHALRSNERNAGRTTATPIGSIAQNLIPLFAVPIQARQIEQQSALESLKLKLGIAELLGKSDPEMRAADLAYKKAETDKLRSEIGNPYAQLGKEDELVARSLNLPPGTPPTEVAQAVLKKKDEIERNRRLWLSDVMTKQAEAIAAGKKSAEDLSRLNSPMAKDPAYKGKFPINKNTLEVGSPAQVPSRALEAEGSDFIPGTAADKATVQGIKVVAQQVDQLERLIPKVLGEYPYSGLSPITLFRQNVDEKPTREASDFDRVANFEQLKGITEAVSNKRLNQTEIKGVGKINRYTDSQSSAMGKVDAMRQLLASTLTSMNLNPAALGPAYAKYAPNPAITDPGAGGAPATASPQIDFRSAPEQSYFERLRAANPEMTAEELVDFAEFGARSGRR